MSLQFSRCLATCAGVLLPVLETARRWHQLADVRALPFWIDDWLIAAFLLYGAWRTRDGRADGRPVLAAAWGFACGMVYASFFSQLVLVGEGDVSGAPGIVVVAIKGLMAALAVAALVATLKWRPSG